MDMQNVYIVSTVNNKKYSVDIKIDLDDITELDLLKLSKCKLGHGFASLLTNIKNDTEKQNKKEGSQ